MKVQFYITMNNMKVLLMLSMIMLSIDCGVCAPYDDYIIKYDLKIDASSENYGTRKTQYEKTCQMIAESNQVNAYQLSTDAEYMDLSFEEMQKSRGLAPVRFSSNPQKTIQTEAIHQKDMKVSAVVLPTTYSLVALGHVSSIKNQGSCGCCWSFASIAMYETVLKMRGFTYGLSEEASLQCTSNYAPNQRLSSCGGGYFGDALVYLEMVGAALRENYPYISGDYGSKSGFKNTPGICAEKNRVKIGEGEGLIYSGLTVQQIKQLIFTEGPFMVGFYANTPFSYYTSGVFSGCPVGSQNLINHAVLLVGYNDTERSWLIKNSWGQTWGQSGYVRLSYDSDCGVSYLLGNIKFTSYNANPQIIISNPALLFDNSGKSMHQKSTLLSLVVMTIIMIFYL